MQVADPGRRVPHEPAANSGKFPYLNGYVSYLNEGGQTVNPFTGLTCPAFSGLANLRLSYAAVVISWYSSITSCGVRYPSAE
jgi:hypothetical protein